MLRHTSHHRLWYAVGIAGILVALLGGSGTAGTVRAVSATLTQGYRAAQPLPAGSLVSLDPRRTDYVVATNTTNAAAVFGVVVRNDDSLLAVDTGTGKVQVASGGRARALVSTLGGDIKLGDEVAVSPFDGIGMKAAPGSQVIGIAQTAFTATSQSATTQTVTDKAGRSHQVKVGSVQLAIGIRMATKAIDQPKLDGVQGLVQALTGRSVSLWRAILSLIIAVVALAALLTLVYASIYGAIISVGRNPLAKTAVFRTLTSVLLMAGLVTVATCTTIFLLLR